jgi:transposase
MADARFIDCDRDTLYLMPPSVQDWLPSNHLARFIVDVVMQLDLRPLENAYAGRGSDAYSPKMLLSLLFYGYATGTFSSRKLEAATYDSVAFRFITANTHPDHDTIARFRKRFLPELKTLFAQILSIAHEMGVLKLGSVSLDGTKVKANASKHKALSWQHACRLEGQIRAEVEALLRKAEEADQENLPDGMNIPEELARRKDRLQGIAKAKEEIQRRASQRYAQEKELYEKKMAERKAKEKKNGRKPPGRPPKAPEAGPKKADQVNLTDEDSRIMPTSGGNFEQGYNAQAGVDMDSLLIVESHLTQQPNDKQQLQPALKNLAVLPKPLGSVQAVVTDAGYFSEGNVNRCETEQITPYIAVDREKHNMPLGERFSQPDPLAPHADPVARMRHRLKTPEGRQIYAKRKSTVETVFGIIKEVMGFRHFLLRGLKAVTGEWDLICMAYNLKRMHSLIT